MCEAQYREYCNASEFKYAAREEYLKNPLFIVKKETWRYKGRDYFYVTDINKLKKLAKNGNQYALNELKEMVR